MPTFTLAISCLTTSNFALIHGPNIPDSYAILLFTASDFTSITSHIHNWMLFLLWFRLSVLSRVFSPLISSSILDIYHPGSSSFGVLYFCLFILLMGFSRQEYWSGLPFPSPVDHIFSELSIMTCPFWVALHSMAHSFIELDKAVVHEISLISFLWLWFSSVCPLMDKDKKLMETYWWERLTEGETGSCSDEQVHAQ